MPARAIALTSLLALIALHAGFAAAQCEPRWLPGDGIPGTNGFIQDVEFWDPDGPGALPELLVVAGEFTVAGKVRTSHIAAWNGEEWITLGGGADARVRALALDDENRLVAAGDFTAIGGIEADFIAQCGPAGWEPVGGGVSGPVRSLAQAPDGIVAAGSFTHAGGLLVNRVAVWNGSAWSALGVGHGSTVSMVAVRPNGEIVALIGTFLSRWNGVAWTNLNGPLFVSSVQALANGDLIVGTPGNGVQRWNGTSWTQLGNGGGNFMHTFLELPGGQILAGGMYHSTWPGGGSCIGLWNGSTWTRWWPIGPHGSVLSLRMAGDGSIIAGGSFIPSAEAQCAYIARHDGVQWHSFGSGTNNFINELLRLPTGEVVASGYFGQVGGTVARRIATWNGVRWEPMGAGADSTVFGLATLADGSVVASGQFAQMGGQPASRVARYAQGQWTPLPGIGVGSVYAVAARGERLIVGGNFPIIGGSGNICVAEWDGASWSPIGSGVPQLSIGGSATRVLIRNDGSVAAAGGFSTQNGAPASHLVAWDGLAWSSLGGWNAGSVPDAIELSNGHLLMSANVPTAMNPPSRIARWDGAAWTPFLPSPDAGVTAYLERSDGSIVIGGEFQSIGTVPARSIAHWNGKAWAPLGGGVDGAVSTIVGVDEDEIAVGGGFAVAESHVSAYFARYTFTNIPWVALHPAPFATTPGQTVTLSATPATGYDNVTFQWQRESSPGSGTWINLSDGPGGASPNGGTVMNASGQINGGEEALLSITSLALSDAGAYRCIISNPCGQDESNPATLTITNPCPPDLTSTAIPGQPGYGVPNGALNNDDFFYFLAAFASGNTAVADLTATAIPGSPGYGIPNGVINNDDFFYYLVLFSAGC